MKGTAEVAVPVPLRQTFHYRVPPALEARARPGVRVLVSFARRKTVGYLVARDTPPPPGITLAPIQAVLDEALPTFDEELLGLTQWMARYYHAPLGECLRAAHPAGTNVKGVPSLRLTVAGREEASQKGRAAEVMARLRESPEPLAVADLGVGASLVKRLVDEGLAERVQVVASPRVEVKLERALRAIGPAPVEARGAGGRRLRRDEIHAWLVGRGTVLRSEVNGEFKGAGSHLRRLIEEGAIAETKVEVLRDPFFGEPVARDTRPTLNAAQREAVRVITSAAGYQGFLLHGVTGSGKTEVYLHAIEAVLARGQGALVLVPEIALTPQLVRRFRARLGDAIAVLHSGLSDAARFDQWRRLRRAEVRVAIGARSAVFAPVAKLGLVVVDEAHDPSFKQSDGVRYQGRDMALVRGARQGAAVVLGSATPSLESTYNVQAGKLRRLVLAERPTGGTLPTVRLIDLRAEPPPKDEASFLSKPLREAIEQTLGRGEQAILFLNRRGFSPHVRCTTCGYLFECDHCAIAMTWHRKRAHLRCHYCDSTRPLPERCGHCGQASVERLGRGTERVEDALQTLYPGARVGRLDRDTAGGRKLEQILTAFRERRLDLLVGTQMVTKGHDFPNVTLVGVLAADSALNFPDFRASERTFQLLTQVAGRAGRGSRPGIVLVQTYDPGHPCLRAIEAQDHAMFSAHELGLRQMRGFPPYGHALSVRIDGRNVGLVRRHAEHLAEHMRRAGAGQGGMVLRGPAPAPIEQIRNRFRWAMLLTGPQRSALHRVVDAIIDLPVPKDVRQHIDVDPYDFL